MKAIGYVLVSTAQRTERGVSLVAQAEKIRAMAVCQNAELIDIIEDGGESAKTLQRPATERLLALVDAKKVHAADKKARASGLDRDLRLKSEESILTPLTMSGGRPERRHE